jgi:hypothetical protein
VSAGTWNEQQRSESKRYPLSTLFTMLPSRKPKSLLVRFSSLASFAQTICCTRAFHIVISCYLDSWSRDIPENMIAEAIGSWNSTENLLQFQLVHKTTKSKCFICESTVRHV